MKSSLVPIDSRLRVGNISYHVGAPYKSMADLDFLLYEENLATENARKLQEGELDIALIPITSFAKNGSFVGLDFGLAEEESSRLIRLVSHAPFDELQTVYVYDDSNASALLLKLIFKRNWGISPRIIPTKRFPESEHLKQNEALLIECKDFEAAEGGYAFEEDLVKLWYERTGLPWVYLIWATRPEVLSLSQNQRLSDTFHRSVKAYLNSSLTLVEKPCFDTAGLLFYFDQSEKMGLELSFQEAFTENLLPSFEYRSHSFRLLDRSSAGLHSPQPTDDLLSRASEGGRLSIREALTLVESASLADLALAGESLRAKLFGENSMSYVRLFPQEVFFRNGAGEVCIEDSAFDGIPTNEISRFCLNPPHGLLDSVESWESLLHTLKVRFDCILEAFGAPKLYSLSLRTETLLPDVVSRLVTAGLDEVPAHGGGFLLDRGQTSIEPPSITPDEWLRTMKWVHRYGATSSCCMRLCQHDSWEHRLLHLMKLRDLQDANPGFRYFFCYPVEGEAGVLSPEERLRVLLIGRIFLDNIPSMKEVPRQVPSFSELLSLSVGVNEARIESTQVIEEAIDPTLRLLEGLLSYGMDFQYRVDSSQRPTSLH